MRITISAHSDLILALLQDIKGKYDLVQDEAQHDQEDHIVLISQQDYRMTELKEKEQPWPLIIL